jgi:hypothetical protein
MESHCCYSLLGLTIQASDMVVGAEGMQDQQSYRALVEIKQPEVLPVTQVFSCWFGMNPLGLPLSICYTAWAGTASLSG